MKMNLTKGKISKLHNKKKQSVKKYKKRAKTHKTKTLRRKHRFLYWITLWSLSKSC